MREAALRTSKTKCNRRGAENAEEDAEKKLRGFSALSASRRLHLKN
jgi:hypothetical protein